MPDMSSATPQVLSDLAGSWNLDPQRTTIQFTTKALWIGLDQVRRTGCFS
jgi:polyisoprenoid-binding protein YceI